MKKELIKKFSSFRPASALIMTMVLTILLAVVAVMFVPVIARGDEPPMTAPLIVPALMAAEAIVAAVLTVRLVKVPAAAVVPPITAPFIVPPVMVAEELSVFVATAIAIGLE